MDILGAFEAGRACISLDGDSIKCVFGVAHEKFQTAASLSTFQDREEVKPFVFVCWASGLGIGFWLRGVQPRTTVR